MEENGNLSKEERTKDLDENIDDRITTLEEKIKNLDEKIEDAESKFVDSWGNVKFTKALLISTLCIYIAGMIINKVFMNFSAPGIIISTIACGIPGLVEGIAYFSFKKDAKKWSKVLNEQRELKKTLDKELEKEKELQKTPEYRIEKTKSAVENFKKIINQDFEDILGISYDEYQKLSPEEQQQLIKDFHTKKDNPPIVDDMKEGKVSLVSSGEDSLLVRKDGNSKVRKLTRKPNNNQNN